MRVLESNYPSDILGLHCVRYKLGLLNRCSTNTILKRNLSYDYDVERSLILELLKCDFLKIQPVRVNFRRKTKPVMKRQMLYDSA